MLALSCMLLLILLIHLLFIVLSILFFIPLLVYLGHSMLYTKYRVALLPGPLPALPIALALTLFVVQLSVLVVLPVLFVPLLLLGGHQVELGKQGVDIEPDAVPYLLLLGLLLDRVVGQVYVVNELAYLLPVEGLYQVALEGHPPQTLNFVQLPHLGYLVVGKVKDLQPGHVRYALYLGDAVVVEQQLLEVDLRVQVDYLFDFVPGEVQLLEVLEGSQVVDLQYLVVGQDDGSQLPLLLQVLYLGYLVVLED